MVNPQLHFASISRISFLPAIVVYLVRFLVTLYIQGSTPQGRVFHVVAVLSESTAVDQER